MTKKSNLCCQSVVRTWTSPTPPQGRYPIRYRKWLAGIKSLNWIKKKQEKKYTLFKGNKSSYTFSDLSRCRFIFYKATFDPARCRIIRHIISKEWNISLTLTHSHIGNYGTVMLDLCHVEQYFNRPSASNTELISQMECAINIILKKNKRLLYLWSSK